MKGNPKPYREGLKVALKRRLIDRRVRELVGRLFVELYDSESLVLFPLEFAYEYLVDFDNNTIEYEEEGKKIVKKLKV